MNTTITMILGILFWILAVVLVLLQAWMWNPKFWDSAAGKTMAPKFWLRVHRWCGYLYFAIYVVMMWQMVPRLWNYQFELPARTVMHAVAAIVLGVVLVTKITILKFFRHFEHNAMPTLGMSLLICTTILCTLSVPYSLRAHSLTGEVASPESLERVRRIMTEAKIADADLVTKKTIEAGREVLTGKCVACHDLRTILIKPRTGAGWHEVIERMAEKPSIFGDPIDENEASAVTAYLIAITPDLQTSAKKKSAIDREQRSRALLVEAQPAGAETYSKQDATALLQTRCTECHELTELDDYGGHDKDGWAELVKRMISEEGATVSSAEAQTLIALLADTRPPKREAP